MTSPFTVTVKEGVTVRIAQGGLPASSLHDAMNSPQKVVARFAGPMDFGEKGARPENAARLFDYLAIIGQALAKGAYSGSGGTRCLSPYYASGYTPSIVEGLVHIAKLYPNIRTWGTAPRVAPLNLSGESVFYLNSDHDTIVNPETNQVVLVQKDAEDWSLKDNWAGDLEAAIEFMAMLTDLGFIATTISAGGGGVTAKETVMYAEAGFLTYVIHGFGGRCDTELTADKFSGANIFHFDNAYEQLAHMISQGIC